MKRLLALSVFSLLSLNLHAVVDPKPAIEAPLASKSLLLDIENIDQTRLVAVGEHGHILMSNDGEQWRQAKVPVQTTLTAVYFVNGNLGWAAGHDATILHTKDGGETWQIQQFMPQLEKPLFDITFKNENEGIAVGAYGQFFRTTNGGETWQAQFHDEFLHPDDIDYLNELKLEDEEAYLDERSGILPHFNRLLSDGRTLYLAGEMGLIAKSNDFGETWLKFDEIYQGSFFDIARTEEGNLVVVGLRGNIFRSLKNGTPWEQSQSNTTALLNAIVLAGESRLFILGNNGMLLESNDDGVTFTQHVQKDGKALVAGTWFKNKLVTVSDVGVKIIEQIK